MLVSVNTNLVVWKIFLKWQSTTALFFQGWQHIRQMDTRMSGMGNFGKIFSFLQQWVILFIDVHVMCIFISYIFIYNNIVQLFGGRKQFFVIATIYH